MGRRNAVQFATACRDNRLAVARLTLAATSSEVRLMLRARRLQLRERPASPLRPLAMTLVPPVEGPRPLRGPAARQQARPPRLLRLCPSGPNSVL